MGFDVVSLAGIIFLLPIIAFAGLALFHHRLPRHGDFAAVAALGICFLLSLAVFGTALIGNADFAAAASFPWLPAGSRILRGGILVDRLTAVMLVVVTFVSFLVHLFSTQYMKGDLRYGRYYCGLLLFTASMLGLVLADNLLYLFAFWELVGLSSYLLIGHWFEKKSAADAAVKAFITTRVGDIGMLIGLLICYRETGSLAYADLFAAVEAGQLAGIWRTAAGLGLFFGAMGKSAQFPLHVWLPDAMEGPTPVSALIHAATMVAAGVYLTGRLLPLFNPPSLLFVAYVGGFTALFAATIAVVQDDIKKVLAYSTISQLGYMMLALGVGGYSSGLFHLTTHAFFKAGLFLGAGAVIFAMHHEQSMRSYGGLWRRMPVTALCYLAATLALIGFPGFSGFWSKDAILADVLAFSQQSGHWFLSFAGFATVLLTAFYMFRQFFLTFTGKPRDVHAYEHAHEVPWQMLLPLVFLAVLSVGSGGFGKWFPEMNPKRSALTQTAALAAAGSGGAPAHRMLELHAAQHADTTRTAHEADDHAAHNAHQTAMVLSTVLALCGVAAAALFFFERSSGQTALHPSIISNRLPGVHRLLLNKYYIDELYGLLFVSSIHGLSRFAAVFDRRLIDAVVNAFGDLARVCGDLFGAADRDVVDGALVLGVARGSAFGGRKLALLQTGYIRHYLLMTVLGLTVISLIYLFGL